MFSFKISSKTEATPLPSTNSAKSMSPLRISIPFDENLGFVNSQNDASKSIVKSIFPRSADDATDSLEKDDDNDLTIDDKEKPQFDSPEETPKPSTVSHQHGSHGPLGPVKHLLNTVRERFHGHGGGPLGGIGAIASILGDRHEATTHESPIETEKDRQTSNSSTGLHVLEFLGTFFTQAWGFLSNIPTLFANSSAGTGVRQ